MEPTPLTLHRPRGFHGNARTIALPMFAALGLLTLGCAGATTTSSSTPTTEAPIGGLVTSDMGHPNLGDEAPDFELTDADGFRVKLSELRGEVIVLHFGTSWCPYCRAELPHLKALRDSYGNRVRVLVIDVGEEGTAYESFRDRVPMDVPFLQDRDQSVAASYAPSNAQPSLTNRAEVAVASNLVIDREGRIRFFTLLDSASFDAELRGLRAALDAVLEEQPEVTNGEALHVRVDRLDWTDERAGELGLELSIAEGYHIMSDAPGFPELIPTAVALEGRGVRVGEIRYPPSVPFVVGEDTLQTFEGRVRVTVPFEAEREARGADVLVRYQACTDRSCLFPRDASLAVQLRG